MVVSISASDSTAIIAAYAISSSARDSIGSLPGIAYNTKGTAVIAGNDRQGFSQYLVCVISSSASDSISNL